MVVIIAVLQLPPSESCSILVNLESLYGICFIPGEVSAMTTYEL